MREPALSFVSDPDEAQARATRRALLPRALDTRALMLGGHFAIRPGGRLTPDDHARRFTPLAAEI